EHDLLVIDVLVVPEGRVDPERVLDAVLAEQTSVEADVGEGVLDVQGGDRGIDDGGRATVDDDDELAGEGVRERSVSTIALEVRADVAVVEVAEEADGHRRDRH